ncbi:MAG TPA: MG2 domain-containing protein [Gemmatimonadales bacterium]|nr:MG2 domain-containing protein [Gemmatimonadales bacterium]
MLSASLRLVLAATLGATALSTADELKVLRVSPQNVGEATEDVTVSFDRPVAGGLDSTVDPRTIFQITPRVLGKLEWRDPVTIRFHPSAPLPAGVTFTVRIANTFQAMDGSRLAAPYTFSFRVKGPRVLDAYPVNQWISPKYLTPGEHFTLLLSAPANLALLAPLISVDVGMCVRGKSIPLRPVRQRRIGKQDERWRYYGDYAGDSTRDLRRVVELAPVESLPANCAAALRIPERVDSITTIRSWAFHTYGPLAVDTVTCAWDTGRCPIGPARIWFSTPVRGSEVLRHVHLAPGAAFSVNDSTAESADWFLDAKLTPRTRYLVTVDSGLTDVFGQRLTARYAQSVATTSYTPQVSYPYGRMVVERQGPRTLAVQHVNADTLVITIVGVPDSLERRILGNQGAWGDVWEKLKSQATVTTVAVPGQRDVPRASAVRIPAVNAARPGTATLQMIRISSPALDTVPRNNGSPFTIAVVQLTDLAIHAKIGAEEGAVWVTGVSDGMPRPGAKITLYDNDGKTRATATTDARGLARLSGYTRDTTQAAGGAGEEECEYCDYSGFEGYVGAVLGTDRALVSVSRYDPDLSPWQFNVSAAWGPDRLERAAGLFTERGIYRPGEPVYAKAIVRDGQLGSLNVPRGDSLRWVFTDRENATVRDTTVALSAFGTSDQSYTIPPNAPLGYYTVRVDRRSGGKWRSAATANYRVAEYRPPEFLVTATTDRVPRFAGDTVRASVEARYLFGAPMARAAVTWYARQRTASPWEYDIPNTEGFVIGEQGWWWEDEQEESPGTGAVLASGTDTLDATGHLTLAAVAPAPPKGKAAWMTLEATITDVNRQTVSAQSSALVHPASIYIGAKPTGTDYFWTAGKERSVDLVAVTPDGARTPGVAIRGTLIRREWHQVRRDRQGAVEDVGDWVSDTVGRCAVTTAAQPVGCSFTPTDGGSYTVRFTAADAKGRPVATSFYRWVVGKDWVPWNDASQFKMDVVPDKSRYNVGDTATILFASPFTNAEAWITVEREGVIDERRQRITSGTTILKLPITEALVPNAFVSILVARGRSAPPQAPDDPGRPTIRVGYAQLQVTPAVKRLTVDVKALADEYRPGDTARVDVRVRDAAGAGRRSEVTLWAVDEGVLSLTGFKTPDPVDLIYRPRGLGLRLASSLTSVAAQITEGEKGQRAPGGGGGMDVAGILRSRFQTTAFFLGSVITDPTGHAVAAAKLPDNLTTFRLMAVAVTAGDRYGSGEAKLLVTRPLLARPALPRFVREGDSLLAGVVVNTRLGGTPTVTVQAQSQGAALLGAATQTATLEAGRGREVRFTFRGSAGDTAAFRFKVTSGVNADAVETRVPIQLPYRPRAFEVAGTLVDSTSAEFVFPEALDPARSRLVLSYGASPLALIRGYRETLHVYPYFCTEQTASVALPLIALYRAQKQLGGAPLLRGDPAAEIAEAVAMISGRQRDDGAIGYWSRGDWSSPWLSAYAGRALLAARAAGVAVNDSVVQRLAGYLSTWLHNPAKLMIPVFHWYDDQKVFLSERVAAADFLSRVGLPDLAVENDLLQRARQLSWEDRMLLAEMLARRRDLTGARSLLAPAWAQVVVEGRRAVLPADASAKYFYFWSTIRPAARLLTATLAVEPQNPLVGPLVETVAQRGRAEGFDWWWDTQDYASAVEALARYDTYRRAAAERAVRVTRGPRVLFEKPAGGTFTDTTIALTGLLATRPDGKQALQVSLSAAGTGAPVFYYLTVREVPQARPVRPSDAGIRVERWYERYDAPTPITRAVEGDLVRVKLRVTIPTLRNFIVVDDALPAGLEAVDISLLGAGLPPVAPQAGGAQEENPDEEEQQVSGAEAAGWYYGYWEYGWWSPWDHRELRDDRVVYVATTLWPGTYTMSYVARATTPGVFVRPPVQAEEMYNPGVNGRSDGGVFTVTAKGP